MAQVFPRSANWASKASILVGLVLVGSILAIVLNINRIYFVNQVNVPIDQPVPFSHKHHVTGMGIDCRYCHTTVEESAFAGIPPTETCMTCHSQIWTEAPHPRTRARQLPRQRTHRVESRPRPARLRLFQPQHPRQPRHWLPVVPRPSRSNAPDVESRITEYGVVPRLPPRSLPSTSARATKSLT